MSCAGKGYGTNPQSDTYLYSQFYSSNVTNSVIPNSTKNCRKYKSFYPSFSPVLNNLSIDSSPQSVYKVVNVTGSNFLPNNTTFIKFGNYGYLPVIYFSSFNLSFEIPEDAKTGVYTVQVVNLYNDNFSPQINRSYPGNLNYSNSLNFIITNNM